MSYTALKDSVFLYASLRSSVIQLLHKGHWEDTKFHRAYISIILKSRIYWITNSKGSNVQSFISLSVLSGCFHPPFSKL